MPTIRVETIPLTETEQCTLAARLYEGMKKMIGDRVIDVYISEYRYFTRKGMVPDAPCALLEMIAALEMSKDELAALTKMLCDEVRTALGRPDMLVTFSYVRRDRDCLGVDGELLSDLYKRLGK